MQQTWQERRFHNGGGVFLYFNFGRGDIFGWGGRIRTSAWRNQNPLPYRLATPQRCALNIVNLKGGKERWSIFC